MSFLVDDDAQATLQVALAFIDACDDNDKARGSKHSSPLTESHATSSDSDSHTSSHPALNSSAEPPRQQSQQGARAAKRAGGERPKGNVEAVRRLRQKKKAEAVHLREEVRQLEAQLSQLQRAQKDGNSLQVYLQKLRRSDEDRLRTNNDGDAEADGGDELLVAMLQPKDNALRWLEVAAMQAQARLASQKLNAELKEAVDKQVKLVESIEAMLANKATSQFGLDLLRDEQKQFLYGGAALAQESGILTELRHRAHQMHLRFDSIFKLQFWAEIADSVICSIRMKQDAVSGPFVELRMSSPLPCDFRAAGEAIWLRTLSVSPVIQTPMFSMKRVMLTKHSFQKSFTMDFDGPAGAVKLRGTAYAQRFVDADRFAYIWVSAIMSNHDETYREQGWAVAVTSPPTGFDADPQQQTLFRVYFQVACDSHEAAASAEAKQRREFVLKTLGSRTRAYHQYTQNLLLDQFAGFHSRQPLLLLGSASC